MEFKEKIQLSNIDFLIESARETLKTLEETSDLDWTMNHNSELEEELKKLDEAEVQFKQNAFVLDWINNRRKRWSQNLANSTKEVETAKESIKNMNELISSLESLKQKSS